MAIPVARVHLAMDHAALPGLLPTPPKCMMLPLLPAPPCAAIVLPCSPPKPSRADAAQRWDAHKTKQSGGGGSSPSSSSTSSSGRASSCEKWASNKKKSAGASASSSSSSSSSNGGNGRAGSDERWDAHKKKPAASQASSSSFSSCTSSRNKRRVESSKRINNSNSRAGASSSAVRWDAHKSGGRRAPPADELLDDGESSTGSNDMELVLGKAAQPLAPLPKREFYAGTGFVASPEPSMLPMPWSLVSVA